MPISLEEFKEAVTLRRVQEGRVLSFLWDHRDKTWLPEEIGSYLALSHKLVFDICENLISSGVLERFRGVRPFVRLKGELEERC